MVLSKINSLHQTNARDFMQLKSTMNDISYSFKQEKYHVFLLCIITLLLLCSFIKSKKTIIVLKRQNYQPRNTKSFLRKNKLHQFNITDCVIICKVGLTLFLAAYKSEQNEILL